MEMWRCCTEIVWTHSEVNRACTITSDSLSISCCAVADDYLLTGSFDKTAKLWNATTGYYFLSTMIICSGEELASIEGHSHFINCVAFSPDRAYFITG